MEQLLNPATLIFLIPIVAIVGGFIVKLRKMEIEREHSESVGHEEYVALRNEVMSLRQRMENVEAIVAGDETEPSSRISTPDNETEEYKSSESGRLRNMLH